ncbi:hypothetical protein [Actinomycetospora termitidis]|uniref:Uncharacterized protein n=1 Tax=Actinomycetospora termitidis TaxID=3053470 RepID=A0ABT7M8M1_9PSEU|nr:hypothetical protein [Actinomycetospora sp. Odt1-22]MDL5157006.1 hypothetical protein [Actinomycetospora sp. Odt1-22]
MVGTRPEVEELEHAMTLVRESGPSVAELLNSALSQPLLAQVTSRSYLHPNGFAKIVLHDAGPTGTSVRLHVWPAVENPSPEDLANRRDSAPHGHRWNFASTLIAGSGLLVEEFEVHHVDDDTVVDPGETVWDEMMFRPSVTASLVPHGKARLTCREYWVRDPIRDIYWCDVTDVHTIGPIDADMTATLVLQGPEVRPTAAVYRRPDSPADPGRRTLAEHEIAELIQTVLAAIGGPRSPERTEPAVGGRMVAVGPSTTELEILGRPTL